MPIEYYLVKNANAANGTGYRPVAQASAGVSMTDFAAQIASQTASQTAHKPEDVLQILLAIGPALGALIAAGTELDWSEFGLFKPNLTAAGVPTNSSPLPTTARGDAAFTPRGGFKTALDDATFSRQEAPSHAPEWSSVAAPFGEIAALKSGDLIQIRGANLDFNNVPTSRKEGVFVRLVGGGAPIPAPNVSVHTAQKIDFQLPNGLAAGVYSLELHTRGAHASRTKAINTFTWPDTLTII